MPSFRFASAMVLLVFSSANIAHSEGLGPSTQTMALLRQVGVTDSQKQQIYNVIIAAAPRVKAQQQSLEAVEIQINEMLYGSSAIAADKLGSLEKQKTYTQQSLDNINLQTFLQIRQVLTPMQISKLSNLHSQLLSLAKQQSVLTGASSVYAFMPQ